jgi:plastocyanin
MAATPTPTSTAPVADISISHFTYAVRGRVKPGQQLIVVNEDEASHSLAADAGNAFDIRVSGGGGIETLTAPMTPGTYDFHCKYHANMHGSLTVQ